MNELIVKEVDFLDTNLLAIQQKETGKIYTAINFILRGLGFDEKQIEYQKNKWVNDKVISKGTLKFSGTLVNAKTGKDILCISLTKLPLALAKINITPKMQKDMPQLTEKLETYQDKCADILADAFLPEISIQNQSQSLIEYDNKIQHVEQRIEKLEDTMTIDYGQQNDLRMLGNSVVVNALGGYETNAYKSMGKKVFARLWKDYKIYFRVNSYKNTPRKRYFEAQDYIVNWHPDANTSIMIKKLNAQKEVGALA